MTGQPPLEAIYKLDSSGTLVQGQASAALGAMFAPLALNVTSTTIAIPSSSPDGSSNGQAVKKSSNIGPIVGGVVGGLGFLLMVGLAVWFWRRRSRTAYDGAEIEHRGVGATTPYQLPSGRYETYIPEQPMSQTISTPRLDSNGRPSMTTGETLSLGSKAREAMQGNQSLSGPPASSSIPSRSAYSSPPASSQSPPSDVVSPVTQLSATDVAGLRQEVEQLRRVMQEIQLTTNEAPPSYNEGDRDP